MNQQSAAKTEVCVSHFLSRVNDLKVRETHRDMESMVFTGTRMSTMTARRSAI